jgi:hypothetical protein
MTDLSQIAELSPISDAEAGRLVSDATHADIIAQITAIPSQPSRFGRSRTRASAGRRPVIRRLAIAVPAVLGTAGAVLIAASAGLFGSAAGPGRADAQALTFIRHGHFIDVFVNDPYADQKKYDAEFKAHGLAIKLSLVPASPSLVDTVIYFGGSSDLSSIKVIKSNGWCTTGGGGTACPIGFRVPLNFHGNADLDFGRPARPGERYEATTTATAPGEILHGLKVTGRRVGAVLALVRSRHATVAEYQHIVRDRGVLSRKVPLNWFVYDADPWAKGQILLFVGKTRHQHVSPPGKGQPVPTPSPTKATSTPGQPVPTPSPTGR